MIRKSISVPLCKENFKMKSRRSTNFFSFFFSTIFSFEVEENDRDIFLSYSDEVFTSFSLVLSPRIESIHSSKVEGGARKRRPLNIEMKSERFLLIMNQRKNKREKSKERFACFWFRWLWFIFTNNKQYKKKGTFKI